MATPKAKPTKKPVKAPMPVKPGKSMPPWMAPKPKGK